MFNVMIILQIIKVYNIIIYRELYMPYCIHDAWTSIGVGVDNSVNCMIIYVLLIIRTCGSLETR